MKILSTNKDEFLERKNKLLEANKLLKKEFIGIDSIIDELVNLVEPWFVFPKNNIRPTVINLWGMTGVGKTSLISRLFELLEHDFVYKFDIGDYVDNGDSKLKYEFSQSVRKIKDSASPVLLFDEFQLGRTVDESGKEIIKSGLRLIWELLDSGKFQMLNESYYTLRIYMYYLKLNEYLQENNIKVENGEVLTGVEDFIKRFGDTSEEIDEDELIETTIEDSKTKKSKDEEPISDEPKKYWLVSPDMWWGIRSVWDERFIDESDVKLYLSTLNGQQTIDFLNDTINFVNKPIEKDFSDSLIFVIGNLDYVYGITAEINPDIDADFFHDHTKKIRLSEVKDELLTRYRPEQLSRLGNNHLIYPSLNCNSYRKIIELQLEAFRESIIERFELNVDFDSTVVDIIYNEGVFPTQGVRPVLSSIDNLVKSYFGRIISDIYINEKEINNIVWSYDNDKAKYKIKFFFNELHKKDLLYEKEYDVVLKTHSLRKSLDNDEQALVATHESGHIVTSIYTSNICPKSAFSRTANDAGGFTWIERPDWSTREFMENDIVISLGGYTAECMIFGEKNLTPGSISDLDKVSGTAQSMLLDYGMLVNETPSRLAGDYSNTFSYSRVKDLTLLDNLVDDLIRKNYKRCQEILKREKTLLLKLSEYLCKNSKIEENTIKEFVEKYGVEKIKEYKTKDNYLNFKEILYSQLEN